MTTCDEELTLFDLNDTGTVGFLRTLEDISNGYHAVHIYISLCICTIGSLANALHICVLTRPVMRKSTVNRILSVIAFCDIVTMLSYLVFSCRFGSVTEDSSYPLGYEYGWIVFLLCHVVGSIALHSIELYLSVATAWIRYKTLKQFQSPWNDGDAALPICAVVGTLIGLLCIPTFAIHSILELPSFDERTNSTITLYTVGLNELSHFNICHLFKLNLWLTGIMFKVIPCILLMFFTFALLYEFRLHRIRRQKICSGSTPSAKRVSIQSDRTTKILLSLLIVFLSTELPQGFLAILNSVWPNDIHQFVYLPMRELLDLLSLINCNTCFIVYPLISSQYRKEFKNLLLDARKRFSKSKPSASSKLRSSPDWIGPSPTTLRVENSVSHRSGIKIQSTNSVSGDANPTVLLPPPQRSFFQLLMKPWKRFVDVLYPPVRRSEQLLNFTMTTVPADGAKNGKGLFVDTLNPQLINSDEYAELDEYL